MEINMHSLNAIRNMEIIDIDTGSKLGFPRDFKFDCRENKVVSLIIQEENSGWFSKEDEKEVLWKNIVKIGLDVILVNNNSNVSTKENE
ncbi:YlmC/YmxH family sporulation protein [Clostridium sp. BJN0001]|uniref:YlmC/YmxH family sporulation protein n=1 Tax=Clostridium sp. BJN0001 TaxID=2930219 RepID=UPI001FD0A1EB|nr:YlmC/YmxH family sporulation protein [Clostridium sp. BJN0001]